jgi:hypothetical protein
MLWNAPDYISLSAAPTILLLLLLKRARLQADAAGATAFMV